MDNTNHVSCPNCGEHIDVNTLLAHQLEEDIRKQYEQKRVANETRVKAQQEELAKAQADFELKKQQENKLFQERLTAELKQARQRQEAELKHQLEEEQKERIESMEKQLNAKTEQIKELNKAQAEIAKLQREKEEMRTTIDLELEKKLQTKLGEERVKIQKLEHERHELKMLELQKQLEDQKKLTEEMKRKQEQGSMQLQGEVQELAIEEWLTSNFPLDSIEEIKKGARGGDCIQVVNTRSRQNCGKVYYESKRTKEFQPSWIEKFKDDMRAKDAEIGVLVTEVMPKDMDRLGMKDGIWICNFEEFKGLSKVLRQSIVLLDMKVESQSNKGDKMGMLYDFLTSSAFRLQIEGIVEGFTQMQQDLDSEKRSMQRIWKSREKQIERVINNTVDMYGSIKGIAGNAIGSIQSLELGPGNDED